MGSCASLPSVTSRTQKSSFANETIAYAMYATQGRRPRMEDKHIACLSLPKHPSYSLFGVFDGFNGNHASSYFSQNILNILDDLPNLEDNYGIIDAIEKLDQQYIHPQKTGENIYNPAAGCTFVFALAQKVDLDNASMSLVLSDIPSACSCSTVNGFVSEYESLKSASLTEDMPSFSVERGYRVRVFWAGDSRAVLMSDSSKFHNLTEDHHCSSPQEKERISAAKGSIINDRIDGVIEVTRCFGCYPMKSDDSLTINQQKMISEPECTTLLCRSNDRLLIFCDGLTKKWTDTQLKARYKHHMQQHEDEKKGNLFALEYLCEQAIDEGSRDNITVLDVKFK